jgi:hypothetical protein
MLSKTTRCTKTNVMIEFQSPERAFVETYVLVLQRFHPGGPGVPPEAARLRNMASARYLDRFEKRNGEWRVARRTLVFGDIVGEPVNEALAFPPDFTVQKHGLDDPIYRLRDR